MQTEDKARRCADCIWYRALYMQSGSAASLYFTRTRYGLCTALSPGCVTERHNPACPQFLPGCISCAPQDA